MDVDFSKLPKTVLQQIPLTLRTYKTIHILEELPVSIQYLVKDYTEDNLSVEYKTVFDISPNISKYSDFSTTEDAVTLVTSYLKNYLMISPGTYPWDPWFGCRLKQQIHTKDINLRQTFIVSEINNIVDVISNELSVNIKVDNIQIVPISTGASTEYNIVIMLTINNIYQKQVTMSF
ncbi:MAG: hypothetical protein PHD05_01260 [Sphaerochaetaceae bacterium]|jgi:hypothetical protein|nr:hypothetical protein [Sphaerochaetaceae bacterium]